MLALFDIRVGLAYFGQLRKDSVQYITDKQAALDREYATTDRPEHHLLNEPLTVAPPTFVRAGRARKIPLVPEVESGQCRSLPDEGEKIT